MIEYPPPWLKDGVHLIDTPGVGSVYQHNTDVAYCYLPNADAALFLLSVDQPFGSAELSFLKDVREYSAKIFFLLNKIDYVSEEDLRESIDFSEKAIEDSLERPVKIFPLSAKLALDAKLSGSDELLQKSLLPEFEKELGDFLMKEKGRTLLVSVLNSLLRSLSQAIFQLELKMKSLSIPLEELKSKLAAFDAKKKEVLSQRHDFDVLLDGELKRLIKKDLDEELGDFKRKLASRLEEEMGVFYEKNKHLSTRRLNAALENFVIESVKNAYNAWWAEEDKRLAIAFENTCNRFIANINETVDALYRFHSELFDIPFESFGNEELWRVKPGFYYKFKEEAVMLELITKSFTLSLPRFIGSRVVLKKMREYMQEMIDRQGGRVRFDFVDRLTKAKEDFRKEAVSRIDATLDSISAATRKGMGQRQQGEAAARETRKILSQREEKMGAIRQRLLAVLESIMEPDENRGDVLLNT